MKPFALISFILLFSSTVFGQEPRVITFDSDQEESNNNEKNVVKISLFEIISGDFPIYYERVLSDKFSAEASLGVTFGDYVGSLFLDYSFFDDNGISAKYGVSFSAAVRFYPIEILEEFYISPEYKYRKYNWEEVFYGAEVSEEFSMVRTYSIPRINIGYTFFYDNQLVFDYYLGIGMNTIRNSEFDYENNMIVETEIGPRPRIHVGFKIGYVF